MTAHRPTHRTATSQARSCATSYAGAALSFALAAAMLASPGPARAAEDSVPLDTKILRSLLSTLGLREEGTNIDYQERAPLVIPPSHALPLPEKPNAVIANNPAWPKDPDVARAKAETDRERKDYRFASEKENDAARPLRPDEMTVGPKPRHGTKPGASPAAESSLVGALLSPKELGYRGGLFSSLFNGDKDEEVGKFTGERPRTSLTQPPPGYQTPSPDQPYGLSKGTTVVKPEDYATTRGTVNR